MYNEVIIIDGNHDINITNDSRMSTIEAMINHIKSNNSNFKKYVIFNKYNI